MYQLERKEMNQQQINLLKEMVEHYEQDIQGWDESWKVEQKGYDKVNYVRGLLSDLEDQIPTERQLELDNKILNLPERKFSIISFLS